MDEDLARVNDAKSDGFIALNYDPGSVNSYEKLHVDINTQVESVLCLRQDDVENVYTTLTIRSINKEIKIMSLLMNESNRKKLQFAGVDEIIYPQEIIGMIVKELLGQPVAFEAIHELRSEQSNINIHEIAITKRVLENYATVGELDNKQYRLVLLGVYKNQDRFYFNPIDETFLVEGDYILIIGNKVFLKEFETHLNQKAHG